MKGRRITLLGFLGVVLIASVAMGFSFFSGSVATVTGEVTNEGKPVAGQILFSLQRGESPEDAGPPVLARIGDDGRYKVELKYTGLYRVVVSPSDLPEGMVPVSKLAWFRNVNPGQNEIDISIRLRRKAQPKN